MAKRHPWGCRRVPAALSLGDDAALDLRYEVDVVGESTGHQTVEGWYRTTDGLPVREHLTITTKQDTVIGITNFDEDYTIDLLTPTPLS